ncbi:hypothetical protein ACJ41O_010993 [Fusarium nematophilum]
MELPYEAQQQVVRGLTQVYENESFKPHVRGCAALSIAFSYISGYGVDSRDEAAAAKWITNAAVWDQAEPLQFRYLNALGQSSGASEGEILEKVGVNAAMGSSIALEDLRTLNPDVFHRLRETIRRVSEYPGVLEYTPDTIDKFTVTDLVKLGEQIGATGLPTSEIRLNSHTTGLLHFAASYGATDAIEYLIERGCDINSRSVEGQTPLLYACRSGHHDVALKLLELGADTTLGDKYTNEAPLHRLVDLDDDKIAEVLRAMPMDQVTSMLHVDAEEPAYNNTFAASFGDGPPLRWAVAHNKADFIRLLLDAGANPWKESKYTKDSAISLAVKLHSVACLSVMLSRDSVRSIASFDQLLCRFLDLAILQNPGQMILVHGAEHTQKMQRTINILIKYGASLSSLHFRGISMTALYMAVKYSSKDVVAHLLSLPEGLKLINTPCDSFGYTPIHESIRRGDMEIFQLLLDHGADPTIPWDWSETKLSTVFVLAKSMRPDASVAMADFLLKTAGPQMLSELIDGASPLDLCIQFQQYRLADCFLRWGADLNREYELGGRSCTLLGHVIGNQSTGKFYVSALKYLLDDSNADRPKASFIVCESTGESVFQYELQSAVGMNVAEAQTRLLFLLSRFGLKQHLEHTDQTGLTALQFASYLGHFYAVKILVDAGSDVNVTIDDPSSFYNGMTALDLAYFSQKVLPYKAESNLPDSFVSSHRQRTQLIIRFLRSAGGRRAAEKPLSTDKTQTFLPVLSDQDDMMNFTDLLNECIEIIDIQEQVDNIQGSLPADDITHYDDDENAARADHDELHRFHVARCVEEASSWFVDMLPFQEWVESPPSILWCTGEVGCGKTMTSSYVVKYLRQAEAALADDWAVGVLYLDRHTCHRQTIGSLLGSLWRQLLKNGEDIPDEAVEALRAYQSWGEDLDSEKLSGLIRLQLSKYTKSFIIVDGLDEDAEDVEVVRELFRTLQQFSDQAGLMVSSRSLDPANLGCTSCARMKIHLPEDCVEKLVARDLRTAGLAEALTAVDLPALVKEVVKASRGQYLLAKLIVDRIKDCETNDEAKAVIAAFPTSLSTAYHEAFQRVISRRHEEVVVAKTVFMWLAHSLRPLKLSEMRAVATSASGQQGELSIDGTSRQTLTPSELKRYCKNLIDVDEELDAIRFTHGSFADFLQQTEGFRDREEAHAALATDCLQYLLAPDFENSSRLRKRPTSHALEQRPFLGYAATHLTEHVGRATRLVSEALLYRILSDQGRLDFILEAGYNHCNGGHEPNRCLPKSAPGLWIAASLNLESVASRLLQNNPGDLTRKDSWNKLTSLEQALHSGHASLGELILKAGAPATGSALLFAVFGGYYPLAEQLVARGADVDFRGASRWNCVERALLDESTQMAKLLFRHGATVQDPIRRIDIWSMLGFAGRYKSIDFFADYLPEDAAKRALLRAAAAALLYDKTESLNYVIDHHLDVNYASDALETLLSIAAAEKPHQIEHLLAKGAKADLSTIWSLAHTAVEGEESEAMFKRLLESVGDVNETMHESTVLVDTASLGKTWITRLLLEKGADPHARDRFGETALSKAAAEGHEGVARLLLDYGCDPATKDNRDQTALVKATKGGHQGVMTLLLEKTPDGTSRSQESLAAAMKSAVGRESAAEAGLLLGTEPDATKRATLATAALPHCIDKGRTYDDSPHPPVSKDLEAVIDILVQNGADVNALHGRNRSRPLHLAVERRSTDLVRILLAHNAKPGLGNCDGCSPLHEAAEKGLADIVSLLLQHGGKVNQGSVDGLTPLSGAVKNGHRAIVEQLLAKMANPAMRDKWGHTTVDLALQRNDEDTATLLRKAVEKQEKEGSEWHWTVANTKSGKALKRLADCPDIELRNGLGETLLYKASERGRKAIVEDLLFKGAVVDGSDWASQSPLIRASEVGHHDIVRLLLEWGAKVGHQDYYGMSALHRAAMRDRASVVKLLLAHKADPKAKDEGGFTPVHAAAREGQLSALKVLLAEDSVTAVDSSTQQRMSCLHLAAAGGHSDAVKLLLDRGWSTSLKDDFGEKVLHSAARKGCADTIKLLLSHGADVNPVSGMEYSPLHTLIGNSREMSDRTATELARIFVDHGADVNTTGGFISLGSSLLSTAVWSGHPGVVQLLLDAGASKEGNGECLCKAASGGHIAVVRVLLDAGFDVNARGTGIDSNSALMEAAEAGHDGVVRLLAARGADVDAAGSFFGHTALFLAANKGHSAVVRTLLRAGSNLEQHMVFPGPTVRHGLFETKDEEVKRVLFECDIAQPRPEVE